MLQQLTLATRYQCPTRAITTSLLLSSRRYLLQNGDLHHGTETPSMLTSARSGNRKWVPRRISRVQFHSLSYSQAAYLSPLQSKEDEKAAEMGKVKVLREKMELIGIKCDVSCSPGLYNYSYCPMCKGGPKMERTLSIHISKDSEFAMWSCFQPSCGWSGKVFVEDSGNEGHGILTEITMKILGLEPLGPKLIAYFAERGISEETLKRNAVVQKSGDQGTIAFTYRHKGFLVGCKYRTPEKRFWQEKGTERWLYGLDDICEASELIIVEGEIDKLSMEEAGFRNCVSVPAGAPQRVSAKDIPEVEKDTAYQYLWNSKECLDKVSRIVLATDGDTSGQALAEELARRLGSERCWRVHWPKRDELTSFKDANEMLLCLGSGALRELIEKSELTCENYRKLRPKGPHMG